MTECPVMWRENGGGTGCGGGDDDSTAENDDDNDINTYNCRQHKFRK
jgi:hypothetical protein